MAGLRGLRRDRVLAIRLAIVMAAAMLLASTAPASASTDPVLFVSGQQSALDSGPGTVSYIQVNDNLVGIEFDLAQPAAVTQLGGMFRTFDASASIYAAVAPLDGSLPDLASLQPREIATMNLSQSSGSVPAMGNTTQLLDAGRYVLVFGNGQYGTSGDVLMLADPDYVNAFTPELPFVVFNNNPTLRINQANSAIASGVFGTFINTLTPGVSLRQPEAFDDAPTITFEVGSTALPTVPGVRFLDHRDGNFSSSSSFTTALHGSQAMGNHSSVEYTDMGLEFTEEPVLELGFWVAQGPPTIPRADRVTLRLLDEADQVIYSTDLRPGGSDEGKMFFGFASETPIARVEWLSNNLGNFFVDDISYVLVPEPVSLSIMVLAAPLLLRRSHRPLTPIA